MLSFDKNGLVNVGDKKRVSKDQFEKFFVENNVGKEKRHRLLESFCSLWNGELLLHLKTYVSKIWIDGSFTKKFSKPADIDAVLLVTPTNKRNEVILRKQISALTDLRDDILKTTNVHLMCIYDYPNINIKKLSCDFYKARNTANENYCYYSELFSYDRKGNHKTLIEMSVKGGVIL
ncbi:hypothetical protein KBX31_11635 [Liquorilactobacillus satsumensis]|uniref:DUF6932 family protein n=1 Tax=Liquorilactobacillus satsumensis TaxID=259059 RepID=UPI0021C28A3F|nr:hypothetical protein [Liquorilactobacillus satsumensis]MCP9313904.1 hypothetical protein [Liquorilactobacillus satsumensis]MCP9327726.1 hypothetical protein [Liquorilactobacillus satsumensis]MCP9359697.1 hypothetical protein [Liquorilactobacillus satsumensis]